MPPSSVAILGDLGSEVLEETREISQFPIQRSALKNLESFALGLGAFQEHKN